MKTDVHKQDVVEPLESALAKLRVKGEVNLTDSERRALQAQIAKRPRGRQRLDTKGVLRRVEIACACYNRTVDGASVKDAVAATAAEFDVSTAKVRKERQMLKRVVLSRPWRMPAGMGPDRILPYISGSVRNPRFGRTGATPRRKAH
jgi:hypothetical protein